jgi:hypothetical protein
MDFFTGTDIQVETEIDLSLKHQFLDLVILRHTLGPLPRRLPDGFEILALYNLITFKSYQESLDAWTLCELVGHFVNYRKQISPSLNDLRPLGDFLLFAVAARYPAALAKEVPLIPVKPGVYDVEGFGLRIRIIVVHELPQEEHNAMLHLFSAREELIHYGQEHFRPQSTETSTLLYQLLRAYSEDETMSNKLKDYVRQSIDELLRELPAEERLKGLPAEERLKGLPAEERLKGLPAEDLRRALPAEERLKGLSPEEVIRILTPEVLEVLNRQLKSQAQPSTTD